MQWRRPTQHEVLCEINPFYFSATRYVNIFFSTFLLLVRFIHTTYSEALYVLFRYFCHCSFL